MRETGAARPTSLRRDIGPSTAMPMPMPMPMGGGIRRALLVDSPSGRIFEKAPSRAADEFDRGAIA